MIGESIINTILSSMNESGIFLGSSTLNSRSFKNLLLLILNNKYKIGNFSEFGQRQLLIFIVIKIYIDIYFCIFNIQINLIKDIEFYVVVSLSDMRDYSF